MKLAEYEKKALTEQEKYDMGYNIKRVKVKSKIYNGNCGIISEP